jgi:hypothetical protein
MSIRHISAILAGGAALTSTEVLVLVALADFADVSEGVCYPPRSLVVKHTRLTDRCVRKILAALVARGLVSVVKASTPRRQPTYQIHFDRLVDLSTFENGTTFRSGRNHVPLRAERRSSPLTGRDLNRQLTVSDPIARALEEQEPEDWFTECGRRHDHACNGRFQHANQLLIDAARRERAGRRLA